MAAALEAVPAVEIVLGPNIQRSDSLFLGTARGRLLSQGITKGSGTGV